MVDTTNVPPVVFTPTGLELPEESAVLAGVQADFNSAFGGNLNPALNTPQGQLATSLAAVIAEANSTFALYVNQINPDTSAGFMQDAIARLYYLDRNPGLPTAVQCDCVGAAGTIIPVGALASDTSGNLYLCQQTGTISLSGTVSLPFANAVNGPIACPAGTLTAIAQGITGWDTIDNPADGVIGADVESQAAFAYRRQQSVALNGHGSLESIYAAVFNVPGVIDVYAIENPTAAVVSFGATNYLLLPNSIYVAVVGGASADVAQAIYTKKDGGCNMNGNTTVTLSDTVNYQPPYPTYDIKFQIPAPTTIRFAVQIANTPGLPSDIVTQVQNAILATFNGTDGSFRARTGATLLASRFYAGVVGVGAQVQVLSILLGQSTPTLTTYTLGIDQAPVTSAANIAVTLV